MDRTSVAMKVLSGSSAGMISASVTKKAATSMTRTVAPVTDWSAGGSLAWAPPPPTPGTPVTALDLDPDLVAAIAIAAAVVALVALLLARDRGAPDPTDAASVPGTAAGRGRGVLPRRGDPPERRRDGAALGGGGPGARTSRRLRVDLADAIRHVAVVRYDAFNDMGGRMSFSAALLDDAGDGVVISSINGRTETRTYAKGVKGGTSEAELSPEEVQVIGYARASHPRS